MEKFKQEFPTENTEGHKHTSRHNQYEFDVYKLIHLTQDISTNDVSMEDCSVDLDDFCWRDSNNNKVTPRQVAEIYKNEGFANAIITHPEIRQHLEKIDRADYSHPILIFKSKIIDGRHRLVKAYSDGKTLIKARIIKSIPQAAIIKIYEKEGTD